MAVITEGRPATGGAGSRRWGRWVGGFVLALVVGFAICEALGWPFLAGPMQRALSSTLQRRVQLSADASADSNVRIHLLGGIRLTAPYIEIGAPAWSQAPHMLLAKDASMTLGYWDLWKASRGEPLRIRSLRAGSLDGRIERLADGRASWQFGKKKDTPDTEAQPTRAPVFGRLQVDDGSLAYRDALVDADLDATFSLKEGTNVSSSGVQKQGSTTGLQFEGQGHFRQQPVRISLASDGVLQVASGDQALALPIKLEASMGGASVTFEGSATDPLHLTALKGAFSVKGPSLAAVGDPLKVTLPSTPPFATRGLLAKDGRVWNVRIDDATIGSSQLGGAFQYDPRPATPLLAGALTGRKLALADLGPSVGASTGKGTAEPPPSKSKTRGDRVLPDKEFDLPALRAMNANVNVDIGELDTGTAILKPLEPLRTHIVLQDGVLMLKDIDARTAQGRLAGSLQIDGRASVALWRADLSMTDVRLEEWLTQKRGEGAPPWIGGRFSARTKLAGEGKSTATILGSLRGEIRLRITDGTVSHLAMEAAGLDIAQGLGVLIKGDQSLPLACSFADIQVAAGTLTPKVMVIDNRDSTIWVDGDVSLASETLDLKVSTEPKDFSPLALRTPVLLKGTFGDPKVSVDVKKLGFKAGAVALLAAVVAPVAAIVPLLDFGNKDDAARGAAECKTLAARMAKQPLPTPAQKAPAPAPVSTRRPA